MKVTKRQKEICQQIISEVVFNGSYKIKNANEHNLALQMIREDAGLKVGKRKNYGRIDTVVRGS